MTPPLYITLIALFVLLEGFFAGTETGLVSISRAKLLKLREREKSRRVSSFYRLMLTSPERVIGVTLVGTNLCVITASAVCSEYFERFVFPDSWSHAFFWSTGVVAVSILLFGELLPKTLFRLHSAVLTPPAARVLSLVAVLLHPIAWVFTSLANGAIRLLGLRERTARAPASDELKLLVDMSARHGNLAESARGYIHEIFDFGNTVAREVMIPLVNIVPIRNTSSIDDLVRVFHKCRFSRIPVFEGRVYNMLGYVSLDDLLHGKLRSNVAPLVRRTIYVPETKRIDQLFLEMQNRKLPLVFVVDEHGGVSGLISMEDLIEEIVGEIRAPDEPHTEPLTPLADGSYDVRGDADIDELRDEYDIPLHKDGYDTLAGFVLYHLGHVPKAGTAFLYRDHAFTVLEATDRRVERVRIALKKRRRAAARGIPGTPIQFKARKPRGKRGAN